MATPIKINRIGMPTPRPTLAPVLRPPVLVLVLVLVVPVLISVLSTLVGVVGISVLVGSITFAPGVSEEGLIKLSGTIN